MRTAQFVSRRSRLRARWIAAAVTLLIFPLFFGLHINFPPFSSFPASSITSASDFASSEGSKPLRDGGSDERSSTDRRKRVRAVIGVQTGFNAPNVAPQYNYALRRVKLRETWFPGDITELTRLESEDGVVLRFVVGHSADAALEAAMNAEGEKHNDLLRLPSIESYAELNKKSLAFFSHVARLYDADFVVKVDDDAFLRLDRLMHALTQWKDLGADYIGCMKTGPIFTSPRLRWYEPQHALLGSKSYFAHAWGTAYVLSGRTATFLAQLPPNSLRFFMNEDVTVGSWMLAFNMKHYDDRRMCEPRCSNTSVVVYDIPKCAGLCDPIGGLPALAGDPACTRAPAKARLVPQFLRVV